MSSIYKNGELPYHVVNVNVPNVSGSIFMYNPEASPLATLIRRIQNKDYEEARAFIKEVCEGE